MKNIIKKIGKSVAIQIVAFGILIGGVAFAAVTFPTATPTGQTAGGKFQSYFTNLFKSCPTGQVIIGHTINGELICSNPTLTTQTRNDAGLSGASGATNGFFQTNSPVNYPEGASGWWHLIDTRHSSNSNNYAMQIAGSFGNQNLYFRKTVNKADQPWSKVVAENGSGVISGNKKFDGNISINNTKPTIYLQDTDHRTAVLHTNSNIFYILSGDANSNTWNKFPMYIDLNTNYSEFGGSLKANGSLESTYLRVNKNNTDKEGGEIVLMNSDDETNRYGRMVIDNYDKGLRLFSRKDSPGEYKEFAIFRPDKTYIGMQGNVGIGTTTPTSKLDVSGTVKATSFLYTSDKRLKKDISTIEKPLEKVLSLRGVSWKWKDSDKKDIGLVAQEVEKVYPELVNTDDKGYKSVQYGNLIGVLIEAIKEQQKIIDKQKLDIENINIRLEKLENK